MPALTVFYIVLVNWLVATILVDSHLFAPLRNHLVKKAEYVQTSWGVFKLPYLFPEGTTKEEYDASRVIYHGRWLKPAQLATCYLCIRVWIGFAQAAYFGGPFGGWAHIVANGLLYAAGGHLILELRSHIAKIVPAVKPQLPEEPNVRSTP